MLVIRVIIIVLIMICIMIRRRRRVPLMLLMIMIVRGRIRVLLVISHIVRIIVIMRSHTHRCISVGLISVRVRMIRIIISLCVYYPSYYYYMCSSCVLVCGLFVVALFCVL